MVVFVVVVIVRQSLTKYNFPGFFFFSFFFFLLSDFFSPGYLTAKLVPSFVAPISLILSGLVGYDLVCSISLSKSLILTAAVTVVAFHHILKHIVQPKIGLFV